jgi:predicted nucleic acid-binding protein
MLNEVRSLAVMVRELPSVNVSSDPADNFLLAMASAGNADYLVSGDRRGILALGRYGKTRLVTLHQFLKILGV